MGTPGLKQRGAARGRAVIGAVALGLLALTVGTFWRVTDFEFVGYDDQDYVLNNPHVRAGLSADSIRWAFTATEAANWHPLTWISHMADVALYGLRPAGHHLTNLLLHAANAAILFLLLRGLTGALWRSALVAALFAVHPLHVESFAWVSERKDLLSTLFWGLAVAAYLRHVRRRGGWYWVLLAAFGAALMAKPMVVTLPLLLLILDVWPLGRLRLPPGAAARGAPGIGLGAALLEKVPLLALAAASTAVTVLAQRAGGMIKPASLYPLPVRALNAALSYAGYLGNTLWPSGLAMPYPHQGSALPVALAVGCGVLLVAISAAVAKAARRAPYLAAGWLWFLVGLLPVIGLVQLADQAMADRYTYVPLTGVLIAVVWGAADLARSRRLPPLALAAAAGVVVAGLAPLAASQAGHWRSMEALVERALQVTAGNYLALTNMGRVRLYQGRTEEAAGYFEEAIRVNPRFSYPYYHLGSLRLSQGRDDEAASWFERTLAVNPGFFEAQSDLGVILSRRGQVLEAIERFRQALRVNPAYAEAHNNLGFNLAKLGRWDEALASYRDALRLKPDFARARANLAGALARLGRTAEAEAVVRAGAALPGNPARR